MAFIKKLKRNINIYRMKSTKNMEYLEYFHPKHLATVCSLLGTTFNFRIFSKTMFSSLSWVWTKSKLFCDFKIDYRLDYGIDYRLDYR